MVCSRAAQKKKIVLLWIMPFASFSLVHVFNPRITTVATLSNRKARKKRWR